MLNVLFAALIAGFALGMAAPSFQYFATGCAAFARLQKVLTRSGAPPPTPAGAPILQLEVGLHIDRVYCPSVELE